MLTLLLVLYGLVASITTFDIRLTQARKQGIEEPELPKWVVRFYWIEWGLFIAILIIDWKVGLISFVVKFILKVLPVLETIGNLLMSPFKK